MATTTQSQEVTLYDKQGNAHSYILSAKSCKLSAKTLAGELIGTWNTKTKAVAGLRAYHEANTTQYSEAKVIRMF
jgi:hypothetical protein